MARDNERSEQQGQYRGEQGSPGWGSYSHGNDLGPAGDRSGNTGGDQYGGGGSRSGSMGTPSMPWQGGQGSRDRAVPRGAQPDHTGRGPKGWQRSDERIRDDLSEQLERHPQIDASEIEVQVQQGDVTLTGSVTDRQTKRLAEDVADAVSGVREVHNQLRVAR
jgi:osmotically-inducible protein OsmY